MIHQVIDEMIVYFGNDVSKVNHALKVHGFAFTIGCCERLDEKTLRIIEIAAVLHDIGIPEAERKYGSCIGRYQEMEGPPIARSILEKLNVSSEITDRVCFLIGNHHTYTKIDNIDFQILVEADFLVNIFEDKMYDNIESIGEKYFKTLSGTKLFLQMYNIR